MLSSLPSSVILVGIVILIATTCYLYVRWNRLTHVDVASQKRAKLAQLCRQISEEERSSMGRAAPSQPAKPETQNRDAVMPTATKKGQRRQPTPNQVLFRYKRRYGLRGTRRQRQIGKERAKRVLENKDTGFISTLEGLGLRLN